MDQLHCGCSKTTHYTSVYHPKRSTVVRKTLRLTSVVWIRFRSTDRSAPHLLPPTLSLGKPSGWGVESWSIGWSSLWDVKQPGLNVLKAHTVRQLNGGSYSMWAFSKCFFICLFFIDIYVRRVIAPSCCILVCFLIMLIYILRYTSSCAYDHTLTVFGLHCYSAESVFLL